MYKRISTVFFTFALIAMLAQPVSSEEGESLGSSIDYAVSMIKPALVRIFVVSVDYRNGREVKYETVGSGVIITKQGDIITNHHVVGKAKQIICTLSSKEEIPADLVGTDPLTDISVIKLRQNEEQEFPVAVFGDSSLLKAGDWVLAMGSPYALSQSVTMGIVSNTELVIPRFLQRMGKFTIEGEDVGSMVLWIGHDAPIFGGNSGGPLVNLKGEIVGINEISLGVSGAIPGNLAKDSAEQIINNGKVTRSWLGFEVQPLLRHQSQTKGGLISTVVEGTPADRAGVLPGDILIKVAEEEVHVRFPEEIPRLNWMLTRLSPNKKVNAVFLRDGKELTLSMTPEEREDIITKTIEIKEWGITARNISIMDAKNMRQDSQDGVLVTTVMPGGPSWEAKPSLAPNDIIVGVNNMPVKNLESFMELTYTWLKGEEKKSVLVAFQRKAERFLTSVNLGIEGIGNHGFNARKAWLPVAVQVLTRDIANSLGIGDTKGVRITQVYTGRSAEKAGLKIGDLIVGLDREPIHASSPEDSEIFNAMIRRYRIGSIVELTLLRGKEKLILPVELEKSPLTKDEMKKYTDKNFEFTVRDITFFDLTPEGMEETQSGIIVENVSEGGWASLANLSSGDFIVSVNGLEVADVSEFQIAMKDIVSRKLASVVFQVRQGIHTMFIELEPIWQK
ncbi:MAG: PDZ domain-containing protein [Nitrospirae bacterium]|nr:PDZ domain-containing protein [Nitrospirota bacterium]